MADSKYLLKILSGPHQGAEVALDDEELLIGSGSDCDLILSDALVSQEHAKIVVADSGLSLMPLDASVYLNGQEVNKDETLPLELFQFVSLGTTHFVIGPTDEEWPPLSAADVPTMTKLEQPEDQGVAESGDDADSAADDDADEAAESQEKLSDDDEDEEVSESMKPVIIGTSALVVLLIIGMIGVFILMAPEPKPVITINPMDKVEQELNRLGIRDDFRVEEIDGTIYVEGWVQDNAKRDALQNALDSAGNRVDIRTYSQEQIVLGVEDLISIWKLPITVEPMDDLGSIRFTGYIGNSTAWNKLKNDIKEDVRGIKFMKDDVITSRKLLEIAGKVFAKHKLERKIEIIPRGNHIITKGFITEKENEDYKKAASEFQAQIGYLVPIKSQVAVAKAEKLYVDLDIDSVAVGDQGVIVTKDGQRYFEGGVLPNGFIVQEIRRDGIILKKGNQEITLNIGEDYDGEQ